MAVVETRCGMANMFSLSIYHPDIEEFIDRKVEFIKDKDLYGETWRPKYLEHANISVEIDNAFIDAVLNDKEIELKSPKDGKIVKKVKAKKLWDKLIYNNWKTADPGILNMEILNKFNPLKGIDDITSTNPCAEYIGQPYTVCNLGSVNLYNMIDWEIGTLDYDKLRYTTELATEYLNYALWANSYPLKKLTDKSRDYRPIGLGFMGLASVFMRLGYIYGDDNSKQLTKEIVEEMMYHVIKKSHDLVPLIGKFKKYSLSTYAKGQFEFKNDKYGDKIKELLKEGIVNERLMAIAPTGSISLIAAGVSSKNASSISGGVEPIFSLAYMRQVNPNTEQAYLIPQYDIALEGTLKDMGYSDTEIQSMIEKIGTKEQPEVFSSKRFLTAQKLPYESHIDILEIVSNGIDMSVSKTINVPNNTTPEEIGKIYIDFVKRGIKGGTIYRDGSRQAILKEKQEEDKKKKKAKELNIILSDLSFNKKGKIEPKQRPILMESIKKTIKYKDKDQDRVFHIDVGFATDAEPFEVFIRATNSTAEFAEFFNGIGRLMSLGFRSNLSISEILNQVKKIKNFRNEYSELARMIVETVDEMIEVRKAKGKKKKDIIENINDRSGWIRDAKGYYIDPDGKLRCPVCGGEVVAEDGCFSCKNGDWNACH